MAGCEADGPHHNTTGCVVVVVAIDIVIFVITQQGVDTLAKMNRVKTGY